MSTVEAGRELDAKVAAMMGWTEVEQRHTSKVAEWFVWSGVPPHPESRSLHMKREQLPHFSSDAYAAFTVVEEMRGEYQVEITDSANGGWSVGFYRNAGYPTGHRPTTANTLPLAICLAALKALEASKGET